MKHTFATSIERSAFHWRIRCEIEAGRFPTYAAAGRTYGYSQTMIGKIVKRAQPPELHGLDEATAHAVSRAGVPLRAAAHIRATYACSTMHEQAAVLGIGMDAVRLYRQKLLRAGLLTRSESYRARAARARRNRPRLLLVHQASGERAPRQAADIASLADAAHLLGVDTYLLEGCIQDGYLVDPRPKLLGSTGKPLLRQPVRHYRFSRADLIDFLRQRGAWPRYSTATIRDPELRRFADAQQSAAGGLWRSATECGRLVGIKAAAASQRVQRGWLAGRETTRHGRIVYYWFTAGEAIPPFGAAT